MGGVEEKLGEEVKEFVKSSSREELVDILEVVYAISKFLHIGRADLERSRREKLRERGGFRERVILDDASVIHKPTR